MKLVAILVFCLLFCIVYAFRTQSVAVTGQLMCGDKPAHNVFVKLSDDDDGPDPDDMLDRQRTGPDGKFNLTGYAMELTDIDPELKIYHNCNDHKPCQRKWVIRIPPKYIYPGSDAKEPLDFGIMNLEVELEEEERDCKYSEN